MKIKNNFFLQLVSFLVIALHIPSIIAGTSYDTEDVAMIQSEAVVDATAETKLLLNEAKSVMDKARQELFSGIIDANNAAILIKGQVAIVAHVKQELQQIITQAVQKVETEQGYLDYFISGAKNLGRKIIAPFKSDYGYTQEDKEIAGKIITGLMDQQDKLTKQYAQLPLKKRAAVKDSYQALVAALNDEINQQQLIAGDALDAKKIFYAVAIAGAAVAGMALMAPEESKAILQEQLAPIGKVVTQQEGVALGQPAEVASEVIPENVRVLPQDASTDKNQKANEEYLQSEQNRVTEDLAEEARRNAELKEKQDRLEKEWLEKKEENPEIDDRYTVKSPEQIRQEKRAEQARKDAKEMGKKIEENKTEAGKALEREQQKEHDENRDFFEGGGREREGQQKLDKDQDNAGSNVPPVEPQKLEGDGQEDSDEGTDKDISQDTKNAIHDIHQRFQEENERRDRVNALYHQLDNIQEDQREFLEARAGKGNEQIDRALQHFNAHEDDDRRTLARRISEGEDLEKLSKELEDGQKKLKQQLQQLTEQSPDLTSNENEINTTATALEQPQEPISGTTERERSDKNIENQDDQEETSKLEDNSNKQPLANADDLEVKLENSENTVQNPGSLTDENGSGDDQGGTGKDEDQSDDDLAFNIFKEPQLDTKKLIHL